MKHEQFTNTDIGISGVVPDGWVEAQPGVWVRHASETDPTHLVQVRVGGLSRDEVMALAVPQLDLGLVPWPGVGTSSQDGRSRIEPARELGLHCRARRHGG